MALSMDFGFVRDEDRRLAVVAEGGGDFRQGFLRNGEGIAVTAEFGSSRKPDYGFLRDDDRRLVVIADADVDHFMQGFPIDAEGRLVVTEDDAVGRMSQGFMRDADGRLVVSGLA